MKKLRKLASAALALSLAVSAFGSSAFATTYESKDKEYAYNNGGKYEKVDGSYAITAFDPDSEYYSDRTSITMISKFDGKTVTRMGNGSDPVIRSSSKSDRNLYLPDTITIITDNAFEGVDGFKRITVNDGCKEIGERAFANSNTEKIILPNSGLTKLGVEAFASSSIDSITLPSSVTKLPDSAFEDCSNLESVTLSEGLTTIGDSTFLGCDDMDEIAIPASVTKIGYDALPEDVTIKGYINSYAQKYAKDNEFDFQALSGTAPTTPGTTNTIALNTYSLSVSAGASSTFSVSNLSSGFTATSANPNIASVAGYVGNAVTINGVSAGTTTITVTASGYNPATLSITVLGSGGTGGSFIQLDTNSYTFNTGNVYYPLARLNLASAPTVVSSNPAVVSVQLQADRSDRADLKAGYSNAYLYQIRAKGPGSAVITFTSGSYSATLPVSVGTSAYGSVTPDKSVNFGIPKGSYYEIRMTTAGTTNMPSFTVGNGNVFKTQYVGKVGDSTYVYRVWGTGSSGQKTGIYTTLPGDKPVLHCEGSISLG